MTQAKRVFPNPSIIRREMMQNAYEKNQTKLEEITIMIHQAAEKGEWKVDLAPEDVQNKFIIKMLQMGGYNIQTNYDNDYNTIGGYIDLMESYGRDGYHPCGDDIPF